MVVEQPELSPITGAAGCGLNTLNPYGLVMGAAQGALGSIGYDLIQLYEARQAYADAVEGCSNLPG
jgi:hypothetical protein